MKRLKQKMKIINICSNFGSYKDGIGDYSKKITEKLLEKDDIEITTISTNITGFNKIQRMLSLNMSKNFFKACKEVKTKKIDIVNIEYPFTEWNPIIVFAFNNLAKRCKKNNVKLVLSLHEYTRVNRLRKKVIEYMVKKSDIVLVTENDIKEKLSYLNSNIYIRNIPSNIPLKNRAINIKHKNLNQYVFFGLINKSKAFDEMIEGWKKFQKEHKEADLILMSASEINILMPEKHNILIKRNLSEDEIADIMQNAGFCILPIKPNVGYINATLKTAILFECIPIGIFCNEIREKYNFYINMDSYSSEEFYKVLESTIGIKDIEEKQENGKKFGEQFTIDRIADNILKIYREIHKGENT